MTDISVDSGDDVPQMQDQTNLWKGVRHCHYDTVKIAEQSWFCIFEAHKRHNYSTRAHSSLCNYDFLPHCCHN